MANRTALILGAGIGGIAAARALRRRLPPSDRIVLIDREADHRFSPSLLWLMTGARRPEQFTRPLAALREHGIEFVRGTVTRIDPAGKSAAVDGTTYAGDAMIIALGADYAPETVPGLTAGGHNLYTLEGAAAARDALAGFTAGRIVVLTAVPMYRCPAAPYEAALLIEANCGERGVRASVQVDIYAAEPAPMATAGPAVSAAIRQMVEARGIGYHPEHQVTAVDPSARSISFANGATARYDLLVYVPPHRAPAVLKEAGLLAESGWIPVDRHTLATRFPDVFAIGDNCVIPLKIGKPLPKAGVFAHGEAEVVARNIARAWTGRGAPASFDGHGACFIETGGARAGMGSGDFYAEPAPVVRLRQPSLLWHLGKVLYEKYWLYRWL